MGDSLAQSLVEEPIIPQAAVGSNDHDFNHWPETSTSGPISDSLAPPTTQYQDTSCVHDLDILWGEFDMNNTLHLPTSFATDYPFDFLSPHQYGISSSAMPIDSEAPLNPIHGERDSIHYESGPLSRYGSRLPSLQPEMELQSSRGPGLAAAVEIEQAPESLQRSKPTLPWRISREDYHQILAVFQRYKTVLPADFEFFSRHALCRYVEGFFSGFHEHLPLLHLPTISILRAAPELILSIAAVGAQYRFEREQAHLLYKAAKSLIEHRIHHRDVYSAPFTALHTPFRPSLPKISSRSNNTACPGGSSAQTTCLPPDSQSDSLGVDEQDRRFETMQAMLLLIALGTWNHRLLLEDAFAMASKIALLMREDGLLARDDHSDNLTWKQWIQVEGRRRTKFVAYTLLNLHSIAYNVPPKLMNSEMCFLNLPLPERQWRASTEDEWAAIRNEDPHSEISFRDSYAILFATDTHRFQRLASSSFANSILIHCIVQQIFFARESHPNLGQCGNASLPLEMIARTECALGRWQHNWEATQESSINPLSLSGPLGFNSTALFRIAYIRLHANLGPCRKLETRDPASMARAFRDAPLPERLPQLYRAVLQSAHSLSIPVRIGIRFVARTQTLTWSIVHSLCNLECVLFLSKWLESVALFQSAEHGVSEEEQRLLSIVRHILSETDLGSLIQQEDDEVKKIKRMAAAVVRLWAETFKGSHVYELMDAFGAALEIYADMLDEKVDP